MSVDTCVPRSQIYVGSRDLACDRERASKREQLKERAAGGYAHPRIVFSDAMQSRAGPAAKFFRTRGPRFVVYATL